MEQDETATEAGLKEACEKGWEYVQQVHEQLGSVYEPRTADPRRDNVLRLVYQAKERRLRAEVAEFTKKQPQGIDEDPVTLRRCLSRELNESVSQLEELSSSLLKTTNQQLDEQIEREKGFLARHKEVKRVLEEKLRAEDEDPGAISENSVAHELNNKDVALSTAYRRLMTKMNAFMHKEYPAPDEQQIRKWKGKRYTGGVENLDRSTAGFVTLQTILQELMNRAVETPHDPYLILLACHWPPYIELMLRCGVCLKHPDDDTRVRLTPFHL